MDSSSDNTSSRAPKRAKVGDESTEYSSSSSMPSNSSSSSYMPSNSSSSSSLFSSSSSIPTVIQPPRMQIASQASRVSGAISDTRSGLSDAQQNLRSGLGVTAAGEEFEVGGNEDKNFLENIRKDKHKIFNL